MNFASGDARRQAALAQLAAAFSAHDFLSAERIARELLSADAGDEEALHLLAQILNRQERAAEAVELMGALCSFNPRCVAYHNDRGVMLAALGRWPEAVRSETRPSVMTLPLLKMATRSQTRWTSRSWWLARMMVTPSSSARLRIRARIS